MSRSFGATTDKILNTSWTGFSKTSGTVGFWFKPNWNSGDSADHVMFDNFTTNGGFLMQKYLDNNLYAGDDDIGVGDQRIAIADTGLFVSGQWAYWTLTWSAAAGQTLYKNAVSKGTHSFSVPANQRTRYSIGNYDPTDSAGTNLNGSIAYFTVWNGIILSSGEISALANGAQPYTIEPTSIALNLPLDGLQSPEPDLSGSAANGTLTGTALASGPPVMQFTPRWPQQVIASAATFNPAWAIGRNQFIEGFAS